MMSVAGTAPASAAVAVASDVTFVTAPEADVRHSVASSHKSGLPQRERRSG